MKFTAQAGDRDEYWVKLDAASAAKLRWVTVFNPNPAAPSGYTQDAADPMIWRRLLWTDDPAYPDGGLWTGTGEVRPRTVTHLPGNVTHQGYPRGVPAVGGAASTITPGGADAWVVERVEADTAAGEYHVFHCPAPS